MTSSSTLTSPSATKSFFRSIRITTPVAFSDVVSADAKRWCLLAVGSLVVAGLLSLAVVVGRLPGLSRIIDDPLFFKRCLVVHVDLALVVWFYAFLAGLLAFGARARPNRTQAGAFAVAVGGVVAMLCGALVRGAQPVLANYVPVIDHPLFNAGLAAFFVGTLVYFIHTLAHPITRAKTLLPEDAFIGLQAGAVTTVIAAATWVSAHAGLPDGLDTFTRAEFLAWGPGHVLQAANACAMLAVWLWLLERATGITVLSRSAARLVFGALVLPQAAMPLLTARGTLDSLYHTGATQLMRWAIFPAMIVVLGLGLRHLHRHRFAALRLTSAAGRVALTGFSASVALAALGITLGACIRGSTTLVPAHYHASLGAVTVALMTAAYFVCDAVRRGRTGSSFGESVWRAARRQLTVFGVGQTVFALGFAIGGAYGLGRKAYAAEQHVRSAGEVSGLIVMGAGGLVAVAGGLWFLFLVLREMRQWWHPSALPAAKSSMHTLP
jgi:cytochrome c oxidase subunit 1